MSRDGAGPVSGVPLGRRRTLLALLGAGVLLRWPLRTQAADGANGLSEDEKARLVALARSRGELAVIVGFVVPGQPPEAQDADQGSGPAAERRQVAIAQAREQFLAGLAVRTGRDGTLSGPGIHGVKLFATIAFVALTADVPALERLLENPLVESVHPDDPVPPLAAPHQTPR